MKFDWKTFFKESIRVNSKPDWIDGELVFNMYTDEPCMVRDSFPNLSVINLKGVVTYLLGDWFDGLIHVLPTDIERFLKLDIVKGEVHGI